MADVTRHTPHEDLPEYLSPAELQVVLDLSRNVVYDLLQRGQIPSVRFGRQIRTPKVALKAMAESSNRP